MAVDPARFAKIMSERHFDWALIGMFVLCFTLPLIDYVIPPLQRLWQRALLIFLGRHGYKRFKDWFY